MNKVSIIIPVYNTKKQYLEECVESLQNQTYREIEMIIVDDGSCEEVAKLCDELLLRDNRIFVYHQENAGVSAARNLGLQKTSGEWVFFMDSDDWLEEEAISQLVQASQGMDIVLGRFFLDEIPFAKGCLEERVLSEKKRELIDSIFLDYHNVYSWMESACAKLYRRSFLIESQLGFPLGIAIGEDAIFNLEAYQKAGNIKYLPIPIYHYRTNVTSAMHTFDEHVLAKYNRLLEKMKEKLIELGCKDFEMQYHFFVVRQLHRLCIQYIFTPDTSFGQKERIEVMENLVKKEPYQTAIKKIKITMLSPRRMLLVLGLRLHCYSLIKFLYISH